MKLLRLSGRKVCERVKTKGNVWKGKHFNVRWLPGPPRNVSPAVSPAIYVGLITSAKLHKSAVKRNRMRRRCREALRITVASINTSLKTSYQLLLLPRSSSLSADFREILADARNFLSSIK